MIKFEFYFCFIYVDISLLPLNYKNVMEFTTVQMNWFRRPSKVRFKKKENNVFRPCQKPKSQINISKKLKKNSPC